MRDSIEIDRESQSLLWGVGLFETMLVVGRQVTLEDRHFERISSAARDLELPEPGRKTWADAITAAMPDTPGGGELGLRCSWIDPGPHGARSSWTMIAGVFPIPETTLNRRSEGRVVLLPPMIRRDTPRFKSLSRLSSTIGLRHALDAGADEGLFTTPDGQILEGTSTNLFAVRGAELVTPPVDGGVLPGVVRSWVIDNASRAGLQVTERLLERDDLLRGSFMTSSLTLLSPIRSIDAEIAAHPGSRFEELRQLFDREIMASAVAE